MHEKLSGCSCAYCPLSCDEFIYCIAKELQLLKSNEFEKVFLDLGDFHMEKLSFCFPCCGLYLENLAVDTVFVEPKNFEIGIVKSAMNSRNYVRRKRGMNSLSEAIQHHIAILFVL